MDCAWITCVYCPVQFAVVAGKNAMFYAILDEVGIDVLLEVLCVGGDEQASFENSYVFGFMEPTWSGPDGIQLIRVDRPFPNPVIDHFKIQPLAEIPGVGPDDYSSVVETPGHTDLVAMAAGPYCFLEIIGHGGLFR